MITIPDFRPRKGRKCVAPSPGSWTIDWHNVIEHCHPGNTYLLASADDRAGAKKIAHSFHQFVRALAAFPAHPTSQLWQMKGKPGYWCRVDRTWGGGWHVWVRAYAPQSDLKVFAEID